MNMSLSQGRSLQVPKSGRFPKQEPTAHLKDLTEALTMSSGVTWTDVKRDFSTPAQATFWAGQLSMGSCPGHCRMLSSTPGLYRRLRHSLTCVNQKRLQRFKIHRGLFGILALIFSPPENHSLDGRSG